MSAATPDGPADALARLSGVLRRFGVTEYAVTDGIALGVWTAPRETRDIDLCGALPAASVDRLLAQHDGIRSGPGEMPDLVRFRVGSWDVDLFVTKSEYDREVLRRAVEVEVAGVRLRVVTPEDLVIHKLVKLLTDKRRLLQDAADLRALMSSRALDKEYLRRWLPPADFALVDRLPALDEEELARALLHR